VSLTAGQLGAFRQSLQQTNRSGIEIYISDGSVELATTPPCDVVVVIDVIRAFTTACVLFSRGAAEIVCVTGQAEAMEIDRHAITVGELEVGSPGPEVIPNSPVEVAKLDLEARRIVMFTLNGTRALHRVSSCRVVMAAAATNAGATAEWILAHAPEGRITLLASDTDSPEDYACARYLTALLQGAPADRTVVAAEIIAAQRSHWERWGRIVSPEMWAAVAADIDICARVDSYPLAMVADVSGPHPILRTASTTVREAR